MDKIVLEIISRFGAAGLMAVIGIYLTLKAGNFFDKVQNSHSEERKDLTDKIIDQNEKMIDVFQKNTDVLSEIRTLIRHK